MMYENWYFLTSVVTCVQFLKDVILLNLITFQFLNHRQFVLCKGTKNLHRDERYVFIYFQSNDGIKYALH